MALVALPDREEYNRKIELMKDIARVSRPNLNTFKALELGPLAWAMATEGCGTAVWYSHLVKAFRHHLHPGALSAAPQELCNVVWALSTASWYREKVFRAYCTHALHLMDQFNPQDLSNWAWALGNAGHYDADLCEQLAARSAGRVKQFTGQGIAILLWGLAVLNHPPDTEGMASLLSALTLEALQPLQTYSIQELCLVCYSLAIMNTLNVPLFQAISRELRDRGADDPDLSGIAWFELAQVRWGGSVTVVLYKKGCPSNHSTIVIDLSVTRSPAGMMSHSVTRLTPTAP